ATVLVHVPYQEGATEAPAPASSFCFFLQAEDGIRDRNVTGVQTCALPICPGAGVEGGLLGDDVAADVGRAGAADGQGGDDDGVQIGRASCRGRGSSAVVAPPPNTRCRLPRSGAASGGRWQAGRA